MATRIKLKNSTVLNKVPTTTDIEVGELAINANAGSPAAYIQDSAGAIVQLAGPGSEPDASETVKGIAEIATTAEVTAGTDDTTIVTPAKLAAAIPAAQDLQSVCDEGSTTTTGITANGTVTANLFSGSLPYSDLTGTPTIPTNNNQLTNGAGYYKSGDNVSLGTITGGGDLDIGGGNIELTAAGAITAAGSITSGSQAAAGCYMQSTGGVFSRRADGTSAGIPVFEGGTVSNPDAISLDADGAATFGGDLTVNTDALVVDASANKVGVGVASPEYTLDVRGNTNISGSIFRRGQDNTTFSITNRAAQPLTFGTNDTERMQLNSSGSLLIGPSGAPATTITADGAITADKRMIAGSGAIEDGISLTYGITSYNNFDSSSNASAVLGRNLDNTGRVWCGLNSTGTTTSEISATGAITCSGSVTAQGTVLTSDQRFKTNVTDAHAQLDDVTALGNSLKNWDWTDDAPVTDKDTRFLGLIAQDVEAICPSLVVTKERTKDGAELTPEQVIPAEYKTESVVDTEEQVIPAEYKKELVVVTNEDGEEKRELQDVLVKEEEVIPATYKDVEVLVKEEEIIPATYEQLDDSYKGIKNDVLIMKLLGAVAELTAKVEELEAASPA